MLAPWDEKHCFNKNIIEPEHQDHYDFLRELRGRMRLMPVFVLYVIVAIVFRDYLVGSSFIRLTCLVFFSVIALNYFVYWLHGT